MGETAELHLDEEELTALIELIEWSKNQYGEMEVGKRKPVTRGKALVAKLKAARETAHNRRPFDKDETSDHRLGGFRGYMS